MATRADRPPLDPRSERAVALTDLALGIEAAVFAVVLARQQPGRGARLHAPLVASMAATAVAALTGAGLHGLTTDRTDPRRRFLWRTSLAAIGLAALSSWSLGARLILTSAATRLVESVAAVLHLPYLAAAVTGDRPYRLAVAAYLPGSTFLAGALAVRLRRGPDRGASGLGLLGMLVTFTAAAVQVGRVGIGPRFDHNALYHSLQALGIALLYAAGRGLLGRSDPRIT
jgi:hypothetical protein